MRRFLRPRHRDGALGLVLMAALCVAAASPADAGSLESGAQPLRKLSRGLANAVAGVLEIPITISAVSEEEGPVAGMSWGLFLGTGAALTRVGVGVLEVLTFPFPLPATGYAPLLRPEFLLQPDRLNFDSLRY